MSNEKAPTFFTLSDLHLEIRKTFDRKMFDNVTADVLLLAGDIGKPHLPIMHEFLQFCALQFQHVVYVPGNHEYWSGQGHVVVDERLEKLCEPFENVHLLRRNVLELSDNTCVLGCTLWSLSREAVTTVHYRGDMNDYRRIKKPVVTEFGTKKHYPVLPADTSAWHKRDIDWLAAELAKRMHQKCIVVTHHAPLVQECVDNPDDYFTQFYASDQSRLINSNSQILLWAYGHTHMPRCFQFNKTCTVWSNPVGYPGEKLK